MNALLLYFDNQVGTTKQFDDTGTWYVLVPINQWNNNRFLGSTKGANKNLLARLYGVLMNMESTLIHVSRISCCEKVSLGMAQKDISRLDLFMAENFALQGIFVSVPRSYSDLAHPVLNAWRRFEQHHQRLRRNESMT